MRLIIIEVTINKVTLIITDDLQQIETEIITVMEEKNHHRGNNNTIDKKQDQTKATWNGSYHIHGCPHTLGDYKTIKASKENFTSKKEHGSTNNINNKNNGGRFQHRNDQNDRQENNNIEENEEGNNNTEENQNTQDTYDEEILTLNENTSSIPFIEFSADVNVALVQSKNEVNNKNKIITGLLDTGVQSIFTTEKSLRNVPHTI